MKVKDISKKLKEIHKNAEEAARKKSWMIAFAFMVISQKMTDEYMKRFNELYRKQFQEQNPN